MRLYLGVRSGRAAAGRMTPPEGPDRADVLVIGGGVLGCAAAYQLARRGVDVLVVERGELNREASGSNAGTLHVQMPGKHFRVNYDRPDLTAAERDHVCATDRLYAEAARAWRTLEAELGVRPRRATSRRPHGGRDGGGPRAPRPEVPPRAPLRHRDGDRHDTGHAGPRAASVGAPRRRGVLPGGGLRQPAARRARLRAGGRAARRARAAPGGGRSGSSAPGRAASACAPPRGRSRPDASCARRGRRRRRSPRWWGSGFPSPPTRSR